MPSAGVMGEAAALSNGGGRSHVCPHCGQRMLMRFGVQLSPRETDLFDLIDQSVGRGGIGIDVLGWAWAGTERTARARADLVKTTIYHINDKLASTDYRIKGAGKFPVVYRVVAL